MTRSPNPDRVAQRHQTPPVLDPQELLTMDMSGWAAADGTQVRHGGYTFEVVRSLDAFEVELLRMVDAIIIDQQAVRHLMDIVRPVRGHSDRAIYLKPIFVYQDASELPNYVAALTDGIVYSLDRLEDAAAVVRRIIRQEEAFERAHAVSFEDNTLTKMLRYLVSRNQTTLDPLPVRRAKLGYAYPILDINFPFRSEQRTHEVLAQAEQDDLLVGTFVDAWYVCSTCSDAHIHLREVCPDCNTANVIEEPLIHHFRCAYVGPASDFEDSLNVGDLICPKCQQKLNHIGVDYDKPSSIYTCDKGHVAQAPYLKARCFTCGTETQAEYLTKRTFKQYELTAKGREKALTGVVASVKSLNEVEGTVPEAMFWTMLRYEIERVRSGQAATTLAVVHFANASELFSFIDRETRVRLLTDLATAVRNQLQPADAMAFTDHATLSCLVPSGKPAEVQRRLETAVRQVRQQIAAEFEQYEALLSTLAEPMTADATPEDQIATLTAATNATENGTGR